VKSFGDSRQIGTLASSDLLEIPFQLILSTSQYNNPKLRAAKPDKK